MLMKKTYLFFAAFLVWGNAFGQFVNIPDPAFKQVLLALFDADSDGEITAEVETYCSCTVDVDDPAIADLTGINAFAVLNWNIRNTSVINIVSHNDFQEDYQSFTFELTNNALLQSVDFSQSTYMFLKISDSPLLTNLSLNHDKISGIDVRNTGLTTLDLTGYAHLTGFRCEYNTQLTSVTLDSPLATDVHCNYNPNLVSLNVGNSAMSTLYCHNNKLQSLVIHDDVLEIYAHHNELMEFELVQLPTTIVNVELAHNNLSELDLSRAGSVWKLDVSHNQLENINFKNGLTDSVIYGFNVSENPELQFVCADTFESEYLQQKFGAAVLVNTYCSFTPGGSYNAVNGSFTVDIDADGCDATDPHFPNAKFQVTHNGTSEAVFSDANGNFFLFVNEGTYVLSPEFENPDYFSAVPIDIVFPDQGGQVVAHHFCVTPTGNHPDAEIVLNGSMPEPGYNTDFTVTLRNKGNQVLSGAATVTFDDSRLDYVSSSPSANANPGSVSWNYAGLQPFETRTYSFVLNLNSPMETPAVNIGDVLPFTASAIVASDETPSDNIFAFSQEVFGSYDPNDITCLEGGVVSPAKIGDYLHYLIRFENTGNANAHNIVVKNMVDATKFDIASLQVLQSSADMVTRVTGNKAEFIFEGIELGAAQHGHVLYKIKTLATLVENTSVQAFADIFFDYNFPVTTNEAETFFQQLSVGEVLDLKISVYPNPTADIVRIKADSSIKSVQLFDSHGRLLVAKTAESNEAAIDLLDRRSGVYFVRATSAKGSSITKVVRK